MTTDLNDSIDDLLGRQGDPEELQFRSVGPAPRATRTQMGLNEPKPEHSEPCPKCRGSGRYGGYSRHGSHCFTCKGSGKLTFKSAPEQRAKARAKVAERKAKRAQEAAQAAQEAAAAWLVANPEIAAWMAASSSDFARSLSGSLQKWGSLTVNQEAAAWRSVERDAERIKEATARAQAAPQVDTGALKAAFDAAAARAQEKGLKLKWPKITVGKVVISPAGANSRNPGAIYVKDAGTYVGKIQDGKFLGTRECTPEVQARVLAFIADPKGSAQAYGIETGICCICGAELRSKWKFKGIGPICAANYGWA